jgi:uncharacterized protein (TIGR03000 family)
MSSRSKRLFAVVVVVALVAALTAGRVMARGGGHGGGHHGGGHHGGHHGGYHGGHHGNHHHSHSHHHAHHHSGHHTHHGWGGGGWGGYGGGWGGGWGGWGGGWGSHLGWGLAGYGLGGWGIPYGGWSNYAANQPISAPLSGNYLANTNATNGVLNNNTPATGTLADTGAPIENPYAETPQNNAQRPPIDQVAANDSGTENEEEEDTTFDYRGAIYLALPTKDAQVYLNGQLVQGEGNQRVLLTPEIDNEDDHPEKFDVRTVWKDNGQEQQRETNVEVGPGAGIAVNFTKPIDPQKPWISLYEPQYDDEEDSSDEPATGATAQENSRAAEQKESAGAPETVAPHAERHHEAARPASN